MTLSAAVSAMRLIGLRDHPRRGAQGGRLRSGALIRAVRRQAALANALASAENTQSAIT